MWQFTQKLCLEEKAVTAKVIEFYIPKNFRSPLKPAFEMQLGKVIEFHLPAKTA